MSTTPDSLVDQLNSIYLVKRSQFIYHSQRLFRMNWTSSQEFIVNNLPQISVLVIGLFVAINKLPDFIQWLKIIYVSGGRDLQ